MNSNWPTCNDVYICQSNEILWLHLIITLSKYQFYANIILSALLKNWMNSYYLKICSEKILFCCGVNQQKKILYYGQFNRANEISSDLNLR